MTPFSLFSIIRPAATRISSNRELAARWLIDFFSHVEYPDEFEVARNGLSLIEAKVRYGIVVSRKAEPGNPAVADR